MKNKIIFRLAGCDISFYAEAPKDITLEQLLKQCNRIIPDWCACGINNTDMEDVEEKDIDLIIDYNDIRKTNEDVSCTIEEL